jgi:hypothetical protein
MVLGDGAFERREGHEGGTHSNGNSVLMREAEENSLPPSIA